MTTTMTATPTRRLLDGAGTDAVRHVELYGVLPHPSLDELLQAVADSGLTGRGGAGFPTAVKVRAVATAGRRPVVVGNAMEGEPLSHKDAVLLTRNPHLVLDGLEILARAMNSKRAILAVGSGSIRLPRGLRHGRVGSRCGTSRAASSPARRPHSSTSWTAGRLCRVTPSPG